MLQSLAFDHQDDVVPFPSEVPTDPSEYTSGSDICHSKDYVVFRSMEFGVKVIPSILFFVLGTMRYLKIRDIG